MTVSKKSQASRASAWERRKLAQVVEVRSGAGSIPASLKDLPHGGGGDLDAEDEEFAVDAPVAPARVLPCQAQHQQADGADGARPARAPGAGSGRVAACQQVAVPAQHRVWPDQQPEPAEHVAREPVQQGGQERPVAGQNRGRVLPSCRSSTVIWWRSARISASLSRSLTGSSRSNANTFVTPR